MNDEQRIVTLDSTYGNLVPAVFSGTTRSRQTQSLLRYRLSLYELSQLWETNWICARICEQGPKDMTRKWVELKADSLDQGKIQDLERYARKLKVAAAFKDAQTWANLFGGAAIFINIDDGLDPVKPVDLNKIKSIQSLRVLDMYEITPRIDPIRTNYCDPDYYETTGQQSILVGANGQPLSLPGLVIHKSRILRFIGNNAPYRNRVENWGWGFSLLDRVYNEFCMFQDSLTAGTKILKQYDIFVHAVAGLGRMIENGNTAKVKSHLRDVYDFLEQYNVLITDGDIEKPGFVSRNLQGIDAWIKAVQEVITAASGMPFSKLWGRIGRAGVGGTGQHDLEEEIWSVTCHDNQENRFREPAETFYQYVSVAKDGPIASEIEDLEVHFVGLIDPDPMEELERQSKQADIDSKYQKMTDPDGTQALTAKEIRESRFGGAEYSFDTTIDPSMTFEDPVDRAVRQAEAMPKPDLQKPFAKKDSRADDNTPIQAVLPFHDFKVGLQYKPYDKRHGRVLPVGYGHLQKTNGADGMAVDVYVGHNLNSDLVYEVDQLVNGEFDEHKYFIGFNDPMDAVAKLYMQIMPQEMFGGIRQVDLNRLRTMRKDSQMQIKGEPLSEEELNSLAELSEEDLNKAAETWDRDSKLPNILNSEVAKDAQH